MIIQIFTASNSKGGCGHNRWGVSGMEALIIANYMLFPWRGLLNYYQYCKLCVGTIEFAF